MQRSQREIAKVTQQYFVVRAPVAGQISGNAGRPFSSRAIAGEGGGGCWRMRSVWSKKEAL